MEHVAPHVIDAFQLAVNRWFCATGEADRLKVDENVYRFATIGEILFWAVALDDTVTHPEGRDDLCLGLRFARNRAAHDLLKTVSERPGLILPMVLPMRLDTSCGERRTPCRYPHEAWAPGAMVSLNSAPTRRHGRGDTSTTYFANSDATSARP